MTASSSALSSAVLQRAPPAAAPELLLLFCCCWLVWYFARRAASVDIEREPLCPENRSSAVCGGGVACSVVRYAFRSVTAVNRALLLLSSGYGGVSVFSVSVFVTASPVRFSMTRGKSHIHPRASANPINRLNTNSCESNAPKSTSRTSASFAHAMVVAGAVADVPCQAPGLPWSTITVRVRAPSTHDCATVNARCAPGSAQNVIGTLRTRALKNLKIASTWLRYKQASVKRTFLNLGLEKIYAGMRVLFGIVPAGPPILYDAAEPLARKPGQSWLQRSATRVVKRQHSVYASSVRKLQSA